MIITIKNNAAGTRSYLGGIVTVAESATTALSRDLNVIICADGTFLSDIKSSNVILNTGLDDLNSGGAIELVKYLGQFSTDPLATLFLYYSIPVNIRQSAGTNAGATVFAMRNAALSPYQFVIESMEFNMIFDAMTPLGPALLTYEFMRFSAATQSGGTSTTPAKMSTLAPTSGLTVNYLDTGLTTSGISFDALLDVVSCPAERGADVTYRSKKVIKLAPGEGFAIRLNRDAMTGQSISGGIHGSLR